MESKVIILKMTSSQNKEYYEDAVIKILDKFDFTFLLSNPCDTIVITLYNGYRLWKYMDLTGFTIDMDHETFNIPSEIGNFAESMKTIVVKAYRPVFNNAKQAYAMMDEILTGK